MLKPKLSAAVVLGFCAVAIASTAVAQIPQPFSADMSTTSANGDVNMKGKFYFSPPKLRMDMAESGERRGPMGGKMSMIVDGDTKMAYMLMVEQQMYMEFPADSRSPMVQRMPKMSDFKSDPCAGRENVTCKKVGTETVNGRACDKWEAKNKNGEKEIFWIDQKLHFPIKSQAANGMTTEFTNIKEGPQDASVFKVPSGYRKFDPAAMGRRPH